MSPKTHHRTFVLSFVLALLSAFAFVSPAKGQVSQLQTIALNGQGRPLGGVNVAVCQGAVASTATVSSNIATLTMLNNPVSAGFTLSSTIVVYGFSGADTYFNGTFVITGVSATQITFALVHANASATSPGLVVQQGTASTPCLPLVTLYSDPTGTNGGSNPFQADGFGNVQFYAANGVYQIQYYSQSVTPHLINTVLPLVPGVGGSTRTGDLDASQNINFSTFGDSFTQGSGLANQTNNYVNRISAAKGWTLTNLGVSSTGANDPSQIGTIIPTITTTNGNYSWLCCVNDMRNNLTATQQLTWGMTVEAGLWWLATPDQNKEKANNSSLVTLAGTWITPPSSYGGVMRSATANGSTATFTVFGTDVVVLGAWQGTNTSTYTITVDGVVSPTYNTQTGAYASVAFSTNFGPTFYHYLNLPEQTHTVVLTCVTASVGNPCYFLAGGTSSGANVSNGPWVYLGNTARLVNPTGYNLPTNPGCPGAPCGSDALVQQFDDLERTIVTDLASAGLNVVYVDINAPGFYVPLIGSNTQADGIHPTDLGNAFIAQAFLNQIKGYVTPSDRANLQNFSQGIHGSFNHSGIGQYGLHVVEDSVTLGGGTATVTLLGLAQFQSSTSYACTTDDVSGTNVSQASPTAGNTFIVNGTGTHVIQYICIGK